MKLKHALFIAGFAALAVIAPLAYKIDRMSQASSLPNRQQKMTGLIDQVEIQIDSLGIPSIKAGHRVDAYWALGYFHAKDRLFQMDLIRRKMRGRLSEIFGPATLESDKAQRLLGFTQVAEQVLKNIPENKIKILDAYSAGVNMFIRSMKARPFEMEALNYEPELWSREDSILVALSMFQLLSNQELDERMLTIMNQALPKDLVSFLTPDYDPFVDPDLKLDKRTYKSPSIPVESIKRSLSTKAENAHSQSISEPQGPLGSNAWAVSSKLTKDGRAILANDMHLPLHLPNIWYRASLAWPQASMTGVTIPGLPLVIAGTNGRVAWGFTNVDGDFLDLVKLDMHPKDPQLYKAHNGWLSLTKVRETITIKGHPPLIEEYNKSIWGPVAKNPILGMPVSIHWTALQPEAINLNLMDMDSVSNVEQGLLTMKGAGGPPQNAVLADAEGHIGWTIMGFIPKRKGMDGTVSINWSSGNVGWEGYVGTSEKPELIDPQSGYIITANNRMVSAKYPYIIGHNYSYSYRAKRIQELLNGRSKMSEYDQLVIALDTKAEPYEYFQNKAIATLLGMADLEDNLALRELLSALKRWNGRMDTESVGIDFLVQWRKDLGKMILGPMLEKCKALDPNFQYRWKQQDVPVMALVDASNPEILPARFTSWSQLLETSIRETLHTLITRSADHKGIGKTWGQVSLIKVQHPFSREYPLLGRLLDMPPVAAACDAYCVKVLNESHGASERMVISPNHSEDGFFEMPGGQSGHPISPNYGDEQSNWASEHKAPFKPGDVRTEVHWLPASTN